MKKIRVRSKGLLDEGFLEKVIETTDIHNPKIGDPIFTKFPETGNAHVLCTIVEILEEVPTTT